MGGDYTDHKITIEDEHILETSIEELMESDDDSVTQKTYKAKSMAFPPLHLNPNIYAFNKQVCHEIDQLMIPSENSQDDWC